MAREYLASPLKMGEGMDMSPSLAAGGVPMPDLSFSALPPAALAPHFTTAGPGPSRLQSVRAQRGFCPYFVHAVCNISPTRISQTKQKIPPACCLHPVDLHISSLDLWLSTLLHIVCLRRPSCVAGSAGPGITQCSWTVTAGQ